MTFESKAIGSQADRAAHVDISKVYGGYFANPENIRAFHEIGLEGILQHFPPEIVYIDFGGGQGSLTESTRKYLDRKGYRVRAIVADGNPAFLDKAQALGLETVLSNLEEVRMKEQADLITMRAVLHYNAVEQQRQILKATYAALKKGGYFVHQVSSGSHANSQLRSAIVNIRELNRAGFGNYHWTSIDETMELHKQAGFSETRLVGFAPPNSWGPEEQWDRFNAKRLKEALVRNDQEEVASIEAAKKAYLEKAKRVIEEFAQRFPQEETGIERMPSGSYIIHYQYPIIRSRK